MEELIDHVVFEIILFRFFLIQNIYMYTNTFFVNFSILKALP